MPIYKVALGTHKRTRRFWLSPLLRGPYSRHCRMNALNRFFALVLIFQLALGPAFAQIFDSSSPFGGAGNAVNVSGISNLKIVHQSADGAEVTLNFDYTYDGLAGPTAKLIAVIEKRG